MQIYRNFKEAAIELSDYLLQKYFMALQGSNTSLRSRKATVRLCINNCETLQDVRWCRSQINGLMRKELYSNRQIVVKLHKELAAKALHISLAKMAADIKAKNARIEYADTVIKQALKTA